LSINSANSYRHLYTKVSCNETIALSHLKFMDFVHVAHSWTWAVLHGLYSQWINQPSAWIAPKVVWVSIKHILPSERSQSSLHQKNYLPLKPWHGSHHSRTTLSTCKPRLLSCQHPKQLTSNLIRYLAPFAFYTRNVETGEVAALKIPKAFGIAVWVIAFVNYCNGTYSAEQKFWNLVDQLFYYPRRLCRPPVASSSLFENWEVNGDKSIRCCGCRHELWVPQVFNFRHSLCSQYFICVI